MPYIFLEKKELSINITAINAVINGLAKFGSEADKIRVRIFILIMKAYNVPLAEKNKVDFLFKHFAIFLIILSAILTLSAFNHLDRSNTFQQTIVKVEKDAVSLSLEDWEKYDF